MTKSDCPNFAYMLLTGSCFNSYYLYQEDELEDAMQQLRIEHIKGHKIAYIGIPYLCPDGTYRLKEYMHYKNDHVIYDDYGKIKLHIVFYLDAGTQQN